jgi:hypothetical protein
MRPSPRRAAAVLVALTLAAAADRAAASPKKGERYVFLVTRVEPAKGVAAAVVAPATARIASAIDVHPDLDGSLPAGAPDPETKPTEFKRFLEARALRAFKVNVELTEYAAEVEQREGRSALLTVRVGLKMLGETVPDRVMGFTGEGTAAVKVEVGKTVRPADRTYADEQALDLATADAIKMAMTRLREPPPSQQKPKKKKKATPAPKTP